MAEWRHALLKTLGYKPTKPNLQFLDSWQRQEGGHTNNSARFNWLNTTQDAPGAIGSINSVGVKKFNSFNAGIAALAKTMMNGYYQDILHGLASGDPYSADVSRGLQTWVAGPNGSNLSYVQRVTGGVSAEPHRQRATRKVQELHATTKLDGGKTPWDKLVATLFDDDPEWAEIMARLDDGEAQATGIVAKGGSLKRLPDATGVAKAAASQLGKPYVFGSGPSTDSFDCSDLIQWAYKQIGVSIPRVTYDQIKAGRSVKGKPLQPGDLIFPNKGHVVMYVGHGKVIAAPYTGTVVQYQNVPSNPLEVRRIL